MEQLRASIKVLHDIINEDDGCAERKIKFVVQANPPEDKIVRDLLQFEYGILYENPETGAYTITGAYLRRLIGHAVPRTQQLLLEADSNSPHRGTVRIQSPTGELQTIKLTFGKWEIFRILYEKRGELVTIEEIVNRLKKKKRAIQNIVTRLRREEFQSLNFNIVNERNRGYRLVTAE